VVWDDQKLNKRRVKLALEHLHKQAEMNVLDIGCGKPDFLAQLSENPNIQTIGVDFTPANWEDTKYKNLTLLQGDWRNIELNTQFDLITAWHYFEHDYDIHQTIEKCCQLLKPNGVLFIAVPNYTSYDAGYYKEYWAAYDVPRHLYHFSPKSMEVLMSKYGLVLDAVKPMWFDSVYVSMLSEKYKKGKGNNFKAFFIGMISNLKTVFNKRKCSSLIYIIRKK
jgi:ubiquinone/menaquinone biosynthesis C-methylase UbiE